MDHPGTKRGEQHRHQDHLHLVRSVVIGISGFGSGVDGFVGIIFVLIGSASSYSKKESDTATKILEKLFPSCQAFGCLLLARAIVTVLAFSFQKRLLILSGTISILLLVSLCSLVNIVDHCPLNAVREGAFLGCELVQRAEHCHLPALSLLLVVGSELIRCVAIKLLESSAKHDRSAFRVGLLSSIFLFAGGWWVWNASNMRLPTEDSLLIISNATKVHQPRELQEPVKVDPLASVYDCLSMTEPNLTFFENPDDASSHFLEIHEALRPWLDKVPRPRNPCIEYDWVWASEKRIANNSRLSDTFGPYIPLLLPWLGLTKRVRGHRVYPFDFLQTLQAVLRPDIPYVTVSQNDDGLLWPTQIGEINISNILVLSAGGYGHVPVPLFQIERYLWDEHEKVTNRSYLVSYVGSMGHAPEQLRERMNSTLTSELGDNYTYYRGKEWLSVMKDSWVSMTPRGNGRSAFHIVEALQQGLIPVYVYLKTKWVPYGDLFESLGYCSTVEDLPELVAKFKSMSKQDFIARENRIATYRESHFSMAGAMEQIFAYLAPHANDLRSDLVCQGLANSTIYD